MTETFTYNAWHKTRYEPLYLECEVEYTPAETGSREFGTGLQIEPDYPEDVALLSVKAGDIDILDVLADHVSEDIVAYYLETLTDRQYD